MTWNNGHDGKPLMSKIDFRGTLDKRKDKNTKYSVERERL